MDGGKEKSKGKLTMSKYFGTDGFRGEAGITLTADHAYKVGRFLGWYYIMLSVSATVTQTLLLLLLVRIPAAARTCSITALWLV